MNWTKAFVILLLLLSNNLLSQTFYLDFGGNYGRFYDLRREEGHFSKEYSQGFGYNFDLRISDIKLDSNFTFQFAVGFEKYEGDFYASDGGQGGASSKRGSLQKQIIDVEFYPLNVRFWKSFIFSTGVEVNFKVNQRLAGISSQWQMGKPSYPDIDLNTIDGFVKSTNWGLNACLGYEFSIGNIKIKPNYKYFLGLSKEFDQIPSNARSQRHNFQIGIGYVIK